MVLPDWRNQSDDTKTRLQNALKQIRRIHVDGRDATKIGHLAEVCLKPWTADLIKPLLTGRYVEAGSLEGTRSNRFSNLVFRTTPNFARSDYSGYLEVESPPVRVLRLEVLVATNLPQVGYHYGRYLINTWKEAGGGGEESSDDYVRFVSVFTLLCQRLKKSGDAVNAVMALSATSLTALLALYQGHWDAAAAEGDKHRLQKAVRLVSNCAFYHMNRETNSFDGEKAKAFVEALFKKPGMLDLDLVAKFAAGSENSAALYAIAQCSRNLVCVRSLP